MSTTVPFVRRSVSARQSLAIPIPHNMEDRASFGVRFNSDELVRSKWPTPAKRLLAVQRAWQAAKRESLVSVSSAEGEFLLFGSLTDLT